MMKYKLIISDYGETMVHTGEDLNQDNIEAIRRFQAEGGFFSIATGREWPSFQRKIIKNNLSNLDEMIVTSCYGAIILSSKTEKVLFDHPIEIKLIVKLIDFMSRKEIEYSIVTKDNTLVKKEINLNKFSWKKQDDQLIFNNDLDIIEYLIKNKIKVYKIDVYSNDNFKVINSYIEKIYPNKIQNYLNPELNFFEIVNISAGKEASYNFIKKYYNLLDKEIVVVGDATNDLGLFKNAINKVAVSNAIKDLLIKSTYIVENSDYCGISRLIYMIINGHTL